MNTVITNYTFNVSAKTLTLTQVSGLQISDILSLRNATRNKIIFEKTTATLLR